MAKKVMVKTNKTDKTAALLVGIVGVVAVVGLLVTILDIDNLGTGSDTTAAAVYGGSVVTQNKWTTCLDLGNKIKLGNKEGDTLVKKDVCTGSAIKKIATVSCVQDNEGDYSYKYNEAEQCASGKSCMKDSSGEAYCG